LDASNRHAGASRVHAAPSGAPGSSAATLRAKPANRLKRLRIAMVVAGRIVQERIVPRRGSVTVGRNERATFEIVGGHYHLTFLDGMAGRVALPGGVVDLEALKARAERVGAAYRVRLTDAAHGRIVLAEATFLFQFVVPPPRPPTPQVPPSVKGFVVGPIDWTMTFIVALSFLMHFGLVGAMYSDWMDPVAGDDFVASGLLDLVQRTAPPIETSPATETAPEASASAPSTEAPTRVAPPRPAAEHSTGSVLPSDLAGIALSKEVEQATIAILTALGPGRSLREAMTVDAQAPVDLQRLAEGTQGISTRTGALDLPAAGQPIKPGQGANDLSSLGHKETAGVSSTAGTVRTVIPIAQVHQETASLSAPIANVEAVIRSQIHPGAKLCYRNALRLDPTQSGRLVLDLHIAPSGEVDTAVAAGPTGLGPSVVACITRVARRARFDAPGGAGATVRIPFVFERAE
jgi:hypothetical protein